MRKIFLGGDIALATLSSARAQKIFFEMFSLVCKAGQTDGGRRTLFLFAQPGGKLNFGFCEIVFPEQKRAPLVQMIARFVRMPRGASSIPMLLICFARRPILELILL